MRLHSFVEPFMGAEDLEALARASALGDGNTRFVGMLCCLEMKKKPAFPKET